MKKVTIKRSKWQRGGIDNVTHLFPDEINTGLWGQRTECGCCLGHILHQAHKIPYNKMSSLGTPEDLYDRGVRNPMVLLEDNYCGNNDFAEKAMDINDDNTISDKMREYRLRILAKKYGYELEFVD